MGVSFPSSPFVLVALLVVTPSIELVVAVEKEGKYVINGRPANVPVVTGGRVGIGVGVAVGPSLISVAVAVSWGLDDGGLVDSGAEDGASEDGVSLGVLL